MDGLLNLTLIHNRALRTRFIRLVVLFLRLFNGIKDRQLSAFQPLPNGLRQCEVIRAISFRGRMANEPNPELMITILAAKNQPASGAIEKDLKSAPRRKDLCSGHTIGIGALGTHRLRIFVEKDFLRRQTRLLGL